MDGHILVITSQPLLDELLDVLQRPKLAEYFPDPEETVALIGAMSVRVEPTTTLNIVADDDDNRVLEAAQAGHADYVVSGDKDLCDLGTFDGMPIVRPAKFLELIGPLPPWKG